MDTETINLHLRAGKVSGQEHTCGVKIKYSEKSAIKAATKMNAKETTRKELEAYPCFFCKMWHIGRKMSKEELLSYIDNGPIH
jgi:hypothetical protein